MGSRKLKIIIIIIIIIFFISKFVKSWEDIELESAIYNRVA